MEATTEQRRGGTLMDLTPGDSAVILRVGSDKGPVKRRLVDMGLTPGTYVTVRKVAPFGDPIEVNLRGYELSLRGTGLSYGAKPPERNGPAHPR